MKSHVQRIQFYTRKAAQHCRQYPKKANRFMRLMAYKSALNRRLETDGYRWKPAVTLPE